MVEHAFLAELMQHMWYRRGAVLEVAKAAVDSWGYDVVLSTQEITRHVQLKASVPCDVSLQLLKRPGACVVAAIPKGVDRLDLVYRFWEPSNLRRPTHGLPVTKSTRYRRDSSERHDREGHRRVSAGMFEDPMPISDLADLLFPKRRRG